MDGDVATDGPYSIEDVPWIMYFNGSYALHGAFWHANFGHEQSHGCVNLSPARRARALRLDRAAAARRLARRLGDRRSIPGTRVIVHTIKPKPHWDDDVTASRD